MPNRFAPESPMRGCMQWVLTEKPMAKGVKLVSAPISGMICTLEGILACELMCAPA